MKLITLSSDFGVQTQGIGHMEAVIYKINPSAKVIHLMHGLPDFNILQAARTMETINKLPIGIHVCVVDPGVGTKRKAIIIETNRGDFFIGPDNGVFIPATRSLGGIKKVVEITNEEYMNKPVSPIFHGRDIFSPAAAYLSKGVAIEEFGKELMPEDLVQGPYEDAKFLDGKIKAKIISINKFGSVHLNISPEEFDKLEVNKGDKVKISFNDSEVKFPFVTTFGEVKKGEGIIIKDDYLKVEIAINMDSFVKKYPVKIGDEVIIRKE